jgi:hypothetical protein
VRKTYAEKVAATFEEAGVRTVASGDYRIAIDGRFCTAFIDTERGVVTIKISRWGQTLQPAFNVTLDGTVAADQIVVFLHGKVLDFLGFKRSPGRRPLTTTEVRGSAATRAINEDLAWLVQSPAGRSISLGGGLAPDTPATARRKKATPHFAEPHRLGRVGSPSNRAWVKKKRAT